ncbi:uncharacterized protein LOC143604038, partial [Bidens hawaiensis]|uniref:uncharacterized protein LOC143604038 n=1 Tax=Bidens hawaiensis TaxID=980011 RepID=UPI00404931AF
MANVDVGDDVLHNVLARLPGMPLLGFQCVSKHWNRVISDPYFMKSRSRRMILLPIPRPLAVIDDNVPAEDEAHSTVRIPSLLEYHEKVDHTQSLNPCIKVTCGYASAETTSPPCMIGFGYGATEDDLKLVRFDKPDHPNRFCFLYWLTTRFIMALNVKEMVFSNIELPSESIGALEDWLAGLSFGSIGGCLCVINKIGTVRFDVWLMKEECSWTKAHSFTFGLE